MGYLGYLWSVNADLLFQTVRLVKRSIKQPLKLLLIGNHRIDLSKHLPDDLKVNVIETGWISYEDINLFLCASDVLILPLKHTQVSNLIWPSKLNDYLAAGRPVVATDIQILRPLFQLKNIGYLTEDNPQALSEAVVSVIKQEGLSAIFGANARALAEEELSWEKLIDRLESLYFGFKK